MILMMMTMTSRTRGAVALPSLMGPFKARLSKGVATRASQIAGSGTARTARGIAFEEDRWSLCMRSLTR